VLVPTVRVKVTLVVVVVSVTEDTLSDAVGPLSTGGWTIGLTFTVPVKPSTAVIVIIDVPDLPIAMVRLVGLATYTNNSIVIVSETECVWPPPVPVRIIVYLPAGVGVLPPVVVTMTVELPDPPVIVGVPKLIVTPAGAPEDVRATLLAKPKSGLSWTLVDPDSPADSAKMLVPLMAMLKSGAGVAPGPYVVPPE
jgi:hypothetical protein